MEPRGVATAASDPRAPSTGASTRQRVLDAAIASIVEVGYYRTSSNEIARRAGLTWGVIQHHFGTRDRLLLEVVREQARRLTATLADAEIRGATVGDRLRALADVVWSHYRRPEFLATAQIVMNLSRDPSTAADTRAALDALRASTNDSWQRLVDQVVEPVRQPAGLAHALYRILRGVAVGDEMLDSLVPHDLRRTTDEDRDLLVTALTNLLEAPDAVDPPPARVAPWSTVDTSASRAEEGASGGQPVARPAMVRGTTAGRDRRPANGGGR